MAELIMAAEAALPGTFGPGQVLEGQHIRMIAAIARQYAAALEQHRKGDRRALEKLDKQLDFDARNLGMVSSHIDYTGLGIVHACVRGRFDQWLRDAVEDGHGQAL